MDKSEKISASDNENNRLVVCAEFVTEPEAYIAKGALENYGIESAVDNAIFNSVLPLGYTPMGAIRLLVRASDLPAALRILHQE